ncbi:MAG TPA: hypothetical protein VFR75_11760 [Solirubrobacterales bacterium]|nr:hypothetical protein [Solirubrobacterales bacterium]
MAVMMPREKWTDERLDDLQAEMRAGFGRVDGEIKELRREMNTRFDAMNRNMVAGFFVIVAAIIGSNAALIASSAF